MRIYLDTCTLQRPLDSPTQIRIALEAEAVLGILALCESGKAELISSEVLLFETLRNPNLARREYALAALSRAKVFVQVTDQVERRAKELAAIGLGPLDALHAASAEEVKADCFCTCDDRLDRKIRTVPNLRVRVIAPIQLAEEIDQ